MPTASKCAKLLKVILQAAGNFSREWKAYSSQRWWRKPWVKPRCGPFSVSARQPLPALHAPAASCRRNCKVGGCNRAKQVVFEGDLDLPVVAKQDDVKEVAHTVRVRPSAAIVCQLAEPRIASRPTAGHPAAHREHQLNAVEPAQAETPALGQLLGLAAAPAELLLASCCWPEAIRAPARSSSRFSAGGLDRSLCLQPLL